MVNETGSKNREAQIIEAAVKLFSINGFDATNVQMIADSVGLNKATLYYHVHSKEELLFRIQSILIEDFLADLESICGEPDLTPTDRLTRAIRNYIVILARRKAEVIIFFREKDRILPELRERIAQRRRRYQDLLVTIIEEGVQSGEFASTDPKLTAFFIIGMCAWLYQWFEPGGRMTAEDIANAAVRFALTGLKDGHELIASPIECAPRDGPNS